MELLGYLAIICIGIVHGSIGAGGSMLAIPVLIYMFSMDMETASAYSLFLVGVTSLTGAALKQKEQLLSARTFLLFGLPSISAAFIARKWIIAMVPEALFKSQRFVLTKDHALLALFSMLMVTSSLILLLKQKPRALPGPPKTIELIALGLIIGLVAGLAGAGGGFLIIPALVIFARLNFAAATGTSLLVIACNCLLGFCGDLFNRSIDWPFLFTVTTLAIAGLLLGYWSQQKIHHRFSLQRGFAWFILVMGISILLRELS